MASHLTLEEREVIAQMHRAGKSQAQIAERLGRSKSTVSRELRRNRSRNGYWAAAAQRIGTKDPTTLALYRKRYVAGIPRRSVAAEEADAALLYRVLADIGGEKLVGPGKTLDPGTFYKGGDGR